MSSNERVIVLHKDKPAEEFNIPDGAKDIQLEPRDLKMLSMMRQIVQEEVQGIKGEVQGINEKLEKMQVQIKAGFSAMIDLHDVNKKRSQNQFVEILHRIHESKSRKKADPEEQKKLIAEVQEKIKGIDYDALDRKEQEAYNKVKKILEE